MSNTLRLLFVITLFGAVNDYDRYYACGRCCNSKLDKQEFKKQFYAQLNTITDNNSYILENDLHLDTDVHVLDDYYNMYTAMVDDIFLPEAALELMTYRELLRRYGIVDALKNIFQDPKRITWYPHLGLMEGVMLYNYFYLKKLDDDDGTYEVCLVKNYTDDIDNNIFQAEDGEGEGINDISTDLNKKQNEEKQKQYEEKQYINQSPIGLKKFGGIYVDNVAFQYLRCDGSCNNEGDCVSCLLNNLLLKLKLYKQRYCGIEDMSEEKNCFVFWLLRQGGSSDSSTEQKAFVLLSTKAQWRYKLNSKLDIKKIKNCVLDEKVRKCFMIEWALTIELLQCLSPIIYGDQYIAQTILYRTIKTKHLKKEYKSKRDLFESTSLCGPVYSYYCNRLGEILGYSYVKFANVPVYRCIYNYIISPGHISMFYNGRSLDYEQEVGCITRNIGFEELFNGPDDMNTFNNSFNKFVEMGNIPKTKDCDAGSNFWNRKSFLISQFMRQLKQNIQKLNIPGIKKIVFSKRNFLYMDPSTEDPIQINNNHLRMDCFYGLNDEHVLDIP